MSVTVRAIKQQREPKRRAPSQKIKTVSYRKWKGVNLTDARTAIGDDELAWMENAVTIGDGAIQILNARGASVATIAGGVAQLFGVVLNGAPVMIAVGSDGSLTQVTPTGVQTVIAPANTVSALAVIAMWQSTTVLIGDPTAGLFSWDGSTFHTITTDQTCTTMAVFAGRLWLGKNRTITYTAPNTFNDFTVGNGAGSTILTDQAFPGNIVALISQVEQLWIVGAGAIDQLSNVAATGSAPSVVTTFTITNILTNLGTVNAESVIGYLRTVALFSPFGIWAVAGFTPQKLSGKIDGLFPQLRFATAPAAVAVVQNLLCLLYLVTYDGQSAQAGNAPQPLILGFVEGRMFFASQGPLTWITSVIVNGVPQAWGTDGPDGHIYRLFGADDTTPVVGKIQGKLADLGAATTEKQVLKAGFEYVSSHAIPNTVLTLDSETVSRDVAISGGAAMEFQNNAGATVTFVNAGGQPVSFVGQGMVLSRSVAALYGRYIGWTVTFNDAPFRVQAIQLQYKPTREWQTS